MHEGGVIALDPVIRMLAGDVPDGVVRTGAGVPRADHPSGVVRLSVTIV